MTCMVVKYRGEIFSVEEIAGMVNGRGVRFERIRENDVVVMLALVGGKLVMEKVKRLAVGKRLLELPPGFANTRFRNLLTGETVEAGAQGTLLCREVFSSFPVGLLLR